MDGTGGRTGGLRVLVLSALSALLAPLIFVTIVGLRRTQRRVTVHMRIWGRRLRHEIARWS